MIANNPTIMAVTPAINVTISFALENQLVPAAAIDTPAAISAPLFVFIMAALPLHPVS
jgi:hypothetical protein